MSELSKVIPGKKINYIAYRDIVHLKTSELTELRLEVIDALLSLDNRIILIGEGGDSTPLAAARTHIKRVLSTLNGFIKAKNKAKTKSNAKAKEKLKLANKKIMELEQEIKRMNLYIKNIENKDK